MTESTCTEAQRIEWHRLMDAVHALTERREERQREAGSWLAWAIDRPGSRDLAQERAEHLARAARRAWRARNRLHDVAQAHPFGREVRARLDARRAAREAAA